MKKRTFSIPDMHSANCVMRLEGLEGDLDGIRAIKGSYHRQTREVTCDETRLNEPTIRQAITVLGCTPQPG